MENVEELQGVLTNDHQLSGDGSSVAANRENWNEDKNTPVATALDGKSNRDATVFPHPTARGHGPPTNSRQRFNEDLMLQSGTTNSSQDGSKNQHKRGVSSRTLDNGTQQEEGHGAGRRRGWEGHLGRQQRPSKPRNLPHIDSERTSHSANSNGRTPPFQHYGNPADPLRMMMWEGGHTMINASASLIGLPPSLLQGPPLLRTQLLHAPYSMPTLQGSHHTRNSQRALSISRQLQAEPITVTSSSGPPQEERNDEIAQNPNTGGETPSTTAQQELLPRSGGHRRRRRLPFRAQHRRNIHRRMNGRDDDIAQHLLEHNLPPAQTPGAPPHHMPPIVLPLDMMTPGVVNVGAIVGGVFVPPSIVPLPHQPVWQLPTGNLILAGAQASLLGPMMSNVPMIASTGNTADHRRHRVQPRSLSRASSMTPGITMMYSPLDREHLSDYQVLIRKQIEYFEANQDDASSSVQGRKKKIIVGQVGLRCRHCRHLPRQYRRKKGSVYYPMKLEGIYQAAQNIAATHLNTSCPMIDPHVKAELNRLREFKLTAATGKHYWAEAGKARGISETETGLRYSHHHEGQP